jgi:hypothetical protein
MTSSDSSVPSTTIRFFISSTFVDSQTERDVLLRQVFTEVASLAGKIGRSP